MEDKERKTPIDFRVKRSKVKVIVTCPPAGPSLTVSVFFLLYFPKRYIFDVKVGKLEESSCKTLPFWRVSLRRHNHFKRETGCVAYHPSPLQITGWSFWANYVDNSVNMGEWMIHHAEVSLN